MNGWIKIHKSIMNHWLWEDPFFVKAWLDLLMSVNYEDKRILFDKKLMTVKKGQLVTSIRKLATRWDCSKEKAAKTLKLFETDEMITIDSDNRRTLLTIVNYEVYQNTRDSIEDTNEDTIKDTGQDANSPQHKNIKNIKEVKEKKNNTYSDQIAQIFDYLNEKTGKHYTGRSEAQKKFIVARLKEGYTVEEFKRVIDNKVTAWINDEKMSQYLRPETLFGTRFETYLNDTETEKQKYRREKDELHERQVEAIRAATDYDWLYNQT